IGPVLGVATAVVVEAVDLAAGVPARDTAAGALHRGLAGSLVDVVTVMEHGVEVVLLAQVAGGGEVARLPVLAARHADPQPIDTRTCRGRGADRADRAGGVCAGVESVPVATMRAHALDLHMHAVAQLGPRERLPLPHDAIEAVVLG